MDHDQTSQDDQQPTFRRANSSNMVLLVEEAAQEPWAQDDDDVGPPVAAETRSRFRSGTIPAHFSPSSSLDVSSTSWFLSGAPLDGSSNNHLGDGPATMLDYRTGASAGALLGRNAGSTGGYVQTPRLRGTMATEGGHVLPRNLDYHFYIVHKVATGRHIAQALHMTLKSEGFKSWLDVDTGHSASTGQDGPTKSNMEEGIRKSANILLVLTKDVLESDWCRQELQWAIDAGKGVVCVHDASCRDDHSNFFDFSKDTMNVPEQFRSLVLEQVRVL